MTQEQLSFVITMGASLWGIPVAVAMVYASFKHMEETGNLEANTLAYSAIVVVLLAILWSINVFTHP